MSAFIDTSVLLASMIASEASHHECRALVAAGKMNLYAHGIAEAFSTLTGGKKSFRLGAATAATLLEDHFVPRLSTFTLTPAETLRAMRECESRGIRGGAIFDYLHLVSARKAKAAKLYTLNVSNFRAFQRPGDPEIVHP